MWYSYGDISIPHSFYIYSLGIPSKRDDFPFIPFIYFTNLYEIHPLGYN